MKSFLPRVALTSLVLGVCATGYAQDPVPIEFYRPLKNSVSIGVRMIGGNAKVKFSNLGTIGSRFGDLTTDTFRIYDNGSWGNDAQGGVQGERQDETNADGYYGENGTGAVTSADGKTRTWSTRTYSPNGRRFIIRDFTRYTDPEDAANNYTVEAIRRDYVNYSVASGSSNEGYTRNWNYNSPSQIGGPDGSAYLDLSNYSVSSNGAGAEAESDDSAGVELQFAHIFKRYKRFEWGINFSAGASNINAKTRGSVSARLNKTSDRYSLAAEDSYGNPLGVSSFPDWWYSSNTTKGSDIQQTVVTGDAEATDYTYPIENARYLNYGTPTSLGTTTSTTNVDGYWQIKGAYYLLRVGPVIRVPIGKKWTLAVGAGGALAYVGSRFVVDEYIELPDVMGTLRVQGEGEEKAMVSGYYADVNLERWLTVRTGFFAGYSVEQMGKYTHELGSRKADVDLGTSGGFRFGIITRF